MKTKIRQMSKRTLAVFLGVMMLVTSIGFGTLITVNALTTLYYDFTNLTSGGYNYINSEGNWTYGTDKSQVITGAYNESNSGQTIAKWEQGGWDKINVKVSDIPAGKNMLIAHSDNTVTWDVYGSGGGGGDTPTPSAPTYYYRGEKNSWGATAMTPSTDGFYAYYSTNGTHQFKIATTESGWDYNYTYVDAGFNRTNVTNIGDQNNDNCKCWQSGNYYLLVYYPSTTVNTTDKPKICASTTLPNDAPVCQPTFTVGGNTVDTASCHTNQTVVFTGGHSTGSGDISYTVKKDSGSYAQNYLSTYNGTSAITFTPSDGAGTYTVKASCNSSGATDATLTITVADPDVYFNWNGDGSDHNPTMTYDATASAAKGGNLVYKLEQTWPGSSTRYIKVFDGSDRFKTSGGSTITDSLPLSESGYATQTSGDNWIQLTTNTDISDSTTAKYTFYWDYTDKKLYVEYPYTVTFDSKGGSSVSKQIVNYGAKATSPSNPTKTGYTFSKWVTTDGGSATFNFNTVYNTNKTAYAKWAAKTSALTFNMNSGTGTAPTGKTATYGSAMPTYGQSAPTRTGYTFAGFYDNTTGGTQYYKADLTSAKNWDKDKTSGTILYARWTEVKAGATVKAYTNGSASSTGGTVKVGVSGVAGATATINDAIGIASSKDVLVASTATGYKFTGWETGGANASHIKLYINSDCSTEYVKATHGGAYTTIYVKTDGTSGITTSNAEVHALFVSKQSALTFNTNGATNNGTQTAAGAISATYGAAMPTITGYVAPTKTGYTLSGWYDATSSGTKYYNANGTSAKNWNKNTEEGTTLYARWTEVTGSAAAKAYTNGEESGTGGTVTVASGSAAASADITAIGISTNKAVSATKAANFDFNGWQFSGTNCTKLRYRFGTSGTWLTPAAGTTYGNSSNTTIYIKTDGSSGITSETAEVHAMFTGSVYTGLTAVGKYSTDGSTYGTAMSTNPTIASTSGTYQTGVNVTAPDVSGYQFITWYSANGDFGNALDKQTKFKPNASNAQAVARYKKIFTISTSVDNASTGAGAAPTINITNGAIAGQANKILAGGTYTIAANPTGSYSQFESFKVNNGTATNTTPRTVTDVSADQNVVVKYKSKVYLRGGSTIGSNWETGDIMQANADGTKYTKSYSAVAGASGGTEYQFKLHNGDYVNPDGTADVKITGGSSTGTYSYQTDGFKNNILTLKKECNVTIESDGSKITAIRVVPTTISQKNITFKHVDGVTITGEYDGTSFSTASADAVVAVYENDEINFTATAASGKYISSLTGATFTPAFEAADTYTGKISNVTAAATVTPTVANKVAITAKTNKSAYGTVSVSPTSARPGEIVTITVTPKSGQLSSLSWTADGTVHNFDLTNGTYNSPATIQHSINSLLASKASPKEKLLTGAGTSKLNTGVATDYTFTMPNPAPSSVTVNATFRSYTAESTWYYNGYDTSGNAKSGYHDMQMTEAMVSGEKFSYYHVEGRGSEGTVQLFTVSNGHAGSGTRYVYFTRPKDWGTWSSTNNPKAHFWNSSGDLTTWPGTEMSWQWNNDMDQGVYKVAIPTGATSVKFNDASSTCYRTVAIDLTTTSGAYYLSGGGSGTDADGYHVSEWNTGRADQGWEDHGTEYFNSNTIYLDHWSTGGFYNHYANNKAFSKPKDGNSNYFSACKDDYYIVVLYPNTTYTFNNNTEATGGEPVVLWMANLPIEEDGVKVYAKDGSIRSESYGVTYANIADTKIYSDSSFTTAVGTEKDGNISGQTYETYNASKGDTIYIRTTINDTAGLSADTTTNRNKYYVRGFCINGEVSELLSWDSSGVYTTSYKIPEDYEGKIEITPIYYLKDTKKHPIVTFRVTGFPKDQYNWGDTLYAYPFYGKLGSQNNAFGAYPGQPLVYYKGQYQIQIPQKSTAWDPYYDDPYLTGNDNSTKNTNLADTSVSGVTMSNGYYDLVHKQVMGYGGNDSSADHVQTYDYGDFYKIFNEKENVDNIVFDFKYETKKHNFENQPAASTTKTTLENDYGSTNGNGFELLTNFHGRHVDLFGTPLSGDAADPSKTTPVYVVSIGGVNGSAGVENIAGYYATEWMVYGSSNGTNYSRITGGGKESIPPEVLVLNDDDNTSFSTTKYPSADANHQVTDWKALYTALEAYRGKPVYISYEAADAQIGSGNYATSGGGGATRNDGRWLYSSEGESITSNIKIQYSDDNGVTYTDLNTTTPQVSGLSAYFTNLEADGETTYSTTIDPDETFDLEAKTTNANYKFVGWYMADGTKISDSNKTTTERSGSYTFVAKFKQVSEGQLMISHHVAKDSTHNGDGTTTIAVVVKNAEGETVRTYEETEDDITLDERIIKSDNNLYTVYVTLKTVPTGEDVFDRTTCSQANKFMNNQSALNTATPAEFSFTVGDLFTNTTQDVKSILYSTYLTKRTYTYNFTFQYTGREGSSLQSFNRSGVLTAAQREEYVEDAGNADRVFKVSFMNKIAPYESNFNKAYKWDFSNASDRTFTKDGDNYTITKSFTIVEKGSGETGYKSLDRTTIFKLPYAHDSYGRPDNLESMPKSTQPNFEVTVEYGKTIKKPYPEGVSFDEGSKDRARLQYYVTAPKVLVENEENKAFQYWKIYKSTDTSMTTEIARCYYESFNFAAYDGYIVVPHFEGENKTGDASTSTSASINFLETSRNQWNNSGNGGKITSNSDANTASDILYNDFQLAFTLANGSEVKYSNANLGVVIQRLDKLETNQDGTPKTSADYYAALEKYSTISTDDINQIKNYANGGGAGSLTLTKASVNKDNLDNKDMINYCYRLYNSIGWSDGKSKTNYANKRYVFRAYSYIIDGGTVTLSNPTYFTLWDEASK